jgi:hypothetical protein
VRTHFLWQAHKVKGCSQVSLSLSLSRARALALALALLSHALSSWLCDGPAGRPGVEPRRAGSQHLSFEDDALVEVKCAQTTRSSRLSPSDPSAKASSLPFSARRTSLSIATTSTPTSSRLHIEDPSVAVVRARRRRFFQDGDGETLLSLSSASVACWTSCLSVLHAHKEGHEQVDEVLRLR